MKTQATPQHGGLLIEVVVAMAIAVIGLWGLLEMQSRLQVSEIESYQRTQALMLVNDMASRITTNRSNAPEYVTTADTPTGYDIDDCSPPGTPSLAQSDSSEWCNALKGANENLSGTSVGAMAGGRGCVEEITPNVQYMVTVTWQGLMPVSAPPESVACGRSLYDDPDTDCTGDLCRRYVTTMVRIAPL